MICKLHEKNNLLGRSTVIDLEAPQPGNFRQVDHRTIDWIVFKNVKYSLGKKDAGIDELPFKEDSSQPKWDLKKLAVDNWFSQVQYYKVKEIIDAEKVKVKTKGSHQKELVLSRDILEKEMCNASVYAEEEKVTKTELA